MKYRKLGNTGLIESEAAPGWAWKHHRAWIREVTKGTQQR